MGKTHGYRRGTRDMFSKKFRTKGPVHLSTYLRVYKVGDRVDIKADPSIQKGMPYKYYHGRTAKVYNVTKRALGLLVTKQVRNRMMEKRINVRVEHVRPSKCQDDFYQRVKENDAKRKAAKEQNIKLEKGSLKRQPKQPRDRTVVKAKNKPIEDLYPIKYEFMG